MERKGRGEGSRERGREGVGETWLSALTQMQKFSLMYMYMCMHMPVPVGVSAQHGVGVFCEQSGVDRKPLSVH